MTTKKRDGKVKREKITFAQRDEILRRIGAGEHDGAIAKTMGVREAAVARVRRKRAPGNLSERAEVPAPAATPPTDGGMAGSDEKTDGGLDAALRAAGIAGETPPGPGSPPVPEDDEREERREVDGKALMALLQGLSSIVTRAGASIYGTEKTPQEVAERAKLSKEEREALAMLAPYAADYAPEVMDKVKPLAAFAFVGVFGFCQWARISEFREEKRQRLAREARNAPRTVEVPAPEMERTE